MIGALRKPDLKRAPTCWLLFRRGYGRPIPSAAPFSGSRKETKTRTPGTGSLRGFMASERCGQPPSVVWVIAITVYAPVLMRARTVHANPSILRLLATRKWMRSCQQASRRAGHGDDESSGDASSERRGASDQGYGCLKIDKDWLPTGIVGKEKWKVSGLAHLDNFCQVPPFVGEEPS